MSDTLSFEGSLVTVPFATGDLESVVADRYRRMLDSHDAGDVLVVTGSSTSAPTFRDGLADEAPNAAVPRVTSLVEQATDVVNQTDDRAVLSDAIRRELAHRFLEERDWDTEYLRRASEQPSFRGDVAGLMATATWQGSTFDATPELVEIGEAVEAFHDWLDDHGHLERGQLISEATAALSDPDRRDRVVDAEAIVALEFEEFMAPDRRYLAALADGLELVCIAETDASVRRTWVEPGPITEHASFSTERSVDGGEPTTRPAATAAYLARETVHRDPGVGDVSVLGAESAADQLTVVADEVERLRDLEGWAYDDLAVALKRSGSGVTETVRELQRAGIPTESTAVVGFGDDPAVRELLRVVRHLSADDERTDALEDPVLDESVLATVETMEGLSGPLRYWATETDLKSRIPENASPLAARAQFGNVRRVFAMAEFVEDTDFLATTWESFATMLERAHESAPRQNRTSATDVDGGVRVDHVQALKNGSYRAVFLLDVVDGEYPGDPSPSRLFPRERVSRMPEFPGVTTVEDAAVEATFPTDSTASGRPLRRYHAEHARRRLAVGAAAATDRLYFCLYDHEDAALEARAQPSRFLTDAYRRLPWTTEASEPVIESEQAAEEHLLSRVDRALADVRRTRSRDVTVSLDDLEADLAEIRRLLDDSGDRGERLAEALRARTDFAAGRVRRD